MEPLGGGALEEVGEGELGGLDRGLTPLVDPFLCFVFAVEDDLPASCSGHPAAMFLPSLWILALEP